VTTYRDGEAAGLVCHRCASFTASPPGVSREQVEQQGPFLCASCLLESRNKALQENASAHGSFGEPTARTRAAEAAARRATPAVLLFALGSVAAAGYFLSWMGTRSAARRAPPIALPVASFLAPSAAPAPPSSGEVPNTVDHGAAGLVRTLGRTPAEEVDEIFEGYARPLREASAPLDDLPAALPETWAFVGGPAASPLNAGAWLTDDELTHPRFLVTRDRLLLGGRSTQHGVAVTCAGAVEPVTAPGDGRSHARQKPMVFVAACKPAEGKVTFRVSRVRLPELAPLLTTLAPNAADAGASEGLPLPLAFDPDIHGELRIARESCTEAPSMLTQTVSTLGEGARGDLLLVGVAGQRDGGTRTTFSFRGYDVRNEKLCSGTITGIQSAGPPAKLELRCEHVLERIYCPDPARSAR
jgi:hypothetical protein